MPESEVFQGADDDRWGWRATVGTCEYAHFGFETQEDAEHDLEAFLASQES